MNLISKAAGDTQNMKTITIQIPDASLAEEIEQIARETGKSLNQLITEAMKQWLEIRKNKQSGEIYHDMDHLFGKWSQEEFEMIQGKIDSERKIDEELWQ